MECYLMKQRSWMHNSDTLVGAAAVKSEQLWLRPQHARSTGQEVGAWRGAARRWRV